MSNNLVCMSCIDGRATNEIMGSPGGDAGNVFRAIYAATQIAPEVTFDQKKLGEIILACAQNLGHQLYFHTDDHAIHHFDPKNASNLEDAIKAQNIGCGYFKLCSNIPEKLEEGDKCVELSRLFLKALVEIIPTSPKDFDIVALHGDHNEKAVKESHLLTPIKADGQTFVYHPKVEASEGSKIVDIVIEHEKTLSGKKDAIIAKYTEICKSHWEHAIAVLAPGIDIEKIE